MPTVCAVDTMFTLEPGTGKLMLLLNAIGGITADVDGLKIKGPRTGEWDFDDALADGNGLRVDAAGNLWAPPDMEVVGFTGTSERWEFLIDTIGVGSTATVNAIPTVTVTNPSTSRAMLVLAVLTAREVEYQGPAGARFETIMQLNTNGGGYVNASSIVQDFLGRAVNDYLQRDGLPAYATINTVAAGGSLTLDARMTLTRNLVGDTEMIAACEGMRLVGIGVTTS